MAVISRKGAAIKELVLSGIPVISAEQVPDEGNMFFGSLLAPWPNRLADGAYEFGGEVFKAPNIDSQGNANHGLVFDRNFEIKDHSDSTLTLSYMFGNDDCYPFEVELVTTFSLDHDKLMVQSQATNHGPTAPFGLGFHPYFLAGNDFRFESQFSTQVLTDNRMIPVGEKMIEGLSFTGGSIDDCFSGSNRAELKTGSFSIELLLDEGFEYFMLYRPQNSPVSLLAIEPMSCKANAFNDSVNDLLLESGQTKNYSFTIKMK